MKQHQKAVETLLDHLVSPPILGYPDFSKSFVLHTDDDGKMRVIGYGSQSLTKAENNYYLHSGKLKFLAFKWAVCEHFRDYLYHAPDVIVYNDNNPLTYVLTIAKLNATGVSVGYQSSQTSHSPSIIELDTPTGMLVHSQDCQWILILT